MLTDTQKIAAFLASGNVTVCKPHKARGIKAQRKIAKPSRAFLAIWANPADKKPARVIKAKTPAKAMQPATTIRLDVAPVSGFFYAGIVPASGHAAFAA